MTLLWLGLILSVGAQVIAFAIAYKATQRSDQAKREGDLARAEAKAAQEQARMQLTRIEAKVGDPDAANRYLEAYKKLTHDSISEKTSDAVRRYFAEKADRDQLRASAKENDQKILNSQRLRIEPVYQSAITKFDGWVSGVQQNFASLKIEKSDESPVQIGATGGRGYLIRGIQFPGDTRVYLNLVPMVIEGGDILQPFHLAFRIEESGGGSVIWSINVSKDDYSLTNYRVKKLRFASFQGSDDPGTDEKFLTAISSSLDEVMTTVFDEYGR